MRTNYQIGQFWGAQFILGKKCAHISQFGADLGHQTTRGNKQVGENNKKQV